MNRTLIRALIAASATFVLVAPSQGAWAAPTEGAPCSALWKSVKVGKNKLQCADTASGGAWVRISATPKSQTEANAQLAAWAAALGIDGQADMEAAVSGASTLQDQLTIAQQQRDANAQIIADQTARVNALNQEISDLPNAIADALSASKAAEVALQPSKQAYMTAQSTVSSMSGSYQSALTNQYVNVANTVLCTFGFRVCSPSSSSSSSYYASIISQYNSASAQLASAKARYDAYYSDYKSKYDKYSTLSNRQPSAQAELADANAKIGGAKGASDGLESALATAHTRLDTISTLTGQLANFSASMTALAAALTPEAIQAAPDWKSYFAQQSVAMGRHVVLRKWLSSTWQKYVTGA